MNLSASIFAVPATFAVALLLVNCGGDSAASSGTAGTPATAGASTGGSAGVGGLGGSAGSAGSTTVGGGGVATGGGGAGGRGGAGGVGGVAAGGGGASSGGSAGGGSTVPPTFATIKSLFLSGPMSCFGNGCHDQEGNPFLMHMDDKFYTDLTTHQTKNCGA